MATTVTLQSLRTQVRQRADQVNSQFITDAELNNYINESYAELYDLLVQKYSDNYYVAPPLLFQTNGQDLTYDLPEDMYKMLGLDLALSNTLDSFVTLNKFQFRDRNKYAVPNFQSFYGVTNMLYCPLGNQILFNVVPSAGQTLRLWYIPKITYLVSDNDTLDGISGWQEYIIVDAAIKCMQKEESDCSVLLLQKQGLITRIEAAAENRDAGIPAKVVDGQYNDYYYPVGNGSGFGGIW